MSANQICFVTSYPLERQDLGGGSWVDRRLVRTLQAAGHEVEVVCVTGPPGQWTSEGVVQRSAGSVPLEIRHDRRRLWGVAVAMMTSTQPYLCHKFTSFEGWPQAAGLLAERSPGRTVLTSGWPALLLADAARVPVAGHVAHNVESAVAAEHAPLPLRVLGEVPRLRRAERWLLGRAGRVLALSRTDAGILREWGIPATALPVPLTAAPAPAEPSVPAARTPEPRWGRAPVPPLPEQPRTPAVVGFIGKAGWPPNTRAIRALLGPVHHRLTQLGVPVDYVLAGRGTEAVSDHPRVVATGRVADISDFYRRVGLVVVPRFGASTGVSVKVLEAAENGVPALVPSPLAAAIDPAGPWLVADDTDSMAAAIARWWRLRQSPDVGSWVRAQDAGQTLAALDGVLPVTSA
ncbi:glycosyltransferase [Actinoalloteichus sp. AHMU CJ021]|uniref:glycosyltransferase n=1 Tax=Actinoalloteichus sp. AHMU CJ021 TaxID=2072503 RepID=UPI00268DF468